MQVIKMNRIFSKDYLRTYSIQFSQILNMFTLALLVPYVIGFFEYGKYAALYAIPGFFQGMIETYVMLLLVKSSLTSAVLKHILILAFVATLLVFSITLSVFELRSALYVIPLFISLLFRSVVTSMAYSNVKLELTKVIIAEALTLLLYILILAACIIGGIDTFYVPYYMVIGGAIISAIYLLGFIKKSYVSEPQDLMTADKIFSPRNLLARIYEDLFITVAPLLMMRAFGATIAGEYRVILSFFKGISKVFPYKYELILRSVREGNFDSVKFIKASAIFCIPGIVAFALYPFIIRYTDLKLTYELVIIVLAAGPVVSLLVIFPLGVMFLRLLPVITVIAFFICFMMGWQVGVLGFTISFLISNILFYLYIIFKAKHFKLS